MAHGEPGQIHIGTSISTSGLTKYSHELRNWNIDRIYLWSCHVGQDKSFVSILQELSGAIVVASLENLGQGKTFNDCGYPSLTRVVGSLEHCLSIQEYYTESFENFNFVSK